MAGSILNTRAYTNQRDLRCTEQTEIQDHQPSHEHQARSKFSPNSNNYVSSIDSLIRGLGVTIKGRGPLIPLVRSTGDVLANNGDRIGLNLVNPGGGEAGDFGMSGTEDTIGICEEVGWRPRESLRLGAEGTSDLESSCRPC